LHDDPQCYAEPQTRGAQPSLSFNIAEIHYDTFNHDAGNQNGMPMNVANASISQAAELAWKNGQAAAIGH
jgi:hypothetical protein